MGITDEKFTIPVDARETQKAKVGKETKDESTLALSGVAEGGLNEGLITAKEEERKEPDKPADGAEKEAESKELKALPSKETAKIVANIDRAILGRENAYADLGELARKDIYYGNSEQLGKLDGKVIETREGDSKAYADASGWDKFKHGLGFGRKEVQEVDGRGVVDKGKVDSAGNIKKREDAQTEESKKEERQQLADSLLKSGAKPEEIDGIIETMKFSHEERGGKYDRRVVTILERSKTEDETAKAAAKIIDADLTGLEKGLGVDLIKNKESLEKHKESGKGLKELTKDLGEAATKGIEDKMAAEEAEKIKTIDGQEKELAAQLNKFRTPLEGRLKEVSGIADEFSTAFEDLKIKESAFAERVRNFDMKIRQAEKSGLLQGTKEKLLQELNTQKAQDVVDLAALKDRREQIQKRLTALQKDKAQAEKMLERINRIGKTREDIRKDQEAAKAAAEAAKAETATNEPGAGADETTPEEAPEEGSDDSGEPAAAASAETPAGVPKAGAGAGKEKPAEAGENNQAGVKAEAKAEKEISMTAGRAVEMVMIRYNLAKETDRKLIEKHFTKKGEEFKPDKILKEGIIKKSLDQYCLNVRKINDPERRLNEVKEIFKQIETLRNI